MTRRIAESSLEQEPNPAADHQQRGNGEANEEQIGGLQVGELNMTPTPARDEDHAHARQAQQETDPPSKTAAQSRGRGGGKSGRIQSG